uniref:PWWP domain-containing protein n=1 Tax=Macrostomum lignano TaxID=282301 RepID=A0A1I8F6H2_9PLAT
SCKRTAMVRTVCTSRACDPVVVQKLWNMVECSRVNKQATTLDRVTRAVMKELSANEQEAAKHIDDALSDGLLERYSWTVAKGSRAGESMEGNLKSQLINDLSTIGIASGVTSPARCSSAPNASGFGIRPVCLAKPRRLRVSSSAPTCVMNSKAEYKRKQIRKLLDSHTHRLKGKPLWKDLGKIGYLDDQDSIVHQLLSINAKARPSEWVSKPCRPAHELVWAKLKGFPFWPAKWLEEKDTTYEVRFFGSYRTSAPRSPRRAPGRTTSTPDELGVRADTGIPTGPERSAEASEAAAATPTCRPSDDRLGRMSCTSWPRLVAPAAGGSAARKRRPSSAVDATGAKKAALTSPSSGVAAGSSSGLSPTRRPPATGQTLLAKSKQKNKKKKPASKRRRAVRRVGNN